VKPIVFQKLQLPAGAYYTLLFSLAVIAGIGGLAAYYMEENGHGVTGMNNQIVWGLPHVFAVFLIVAASGALNVASISSVFGRTAYKPLARMSGLVAIALLVGGLAVLVLDLGRPDRLIVAMTSYNFKSIFAWNIFLYTGFIAVTGIYLWMMMERRMNVFMKTAALAAFIWRLALTTGTGLIFGFLVARQAYGTAIMAPLFIAMSFAFGLAIFQILISVIFRATASELGDYIILRMGRLLRWFIAGCVYFLIVYHLTNLYAAEHTGVETFVLLSGGTITQVFWIGQVFIGLILPLAILMKSSCTTTTQVSLASVLVIIGGLSAIYVIIIGGQAYPLVLFPGMEVSSSFFDGVFNSYSPSLPEFLLGMGGVALSLLIILVAMRVMDFLPRSLADKDINPHYKPEASA